MYFPILPSEFWESYGANTATSQGTQLTASATANSPGSWVSLGTVGATNICKFQFFAWLMAAASYPCYGLIDIGIGASGSQTVWIPSLLMSTDAVNRGELEMILPLGLPSGTQIWARFSASVASATCYVMAQGCQQTDETLPFFTGVTAYGVTSASSNGTNIDPGTSANTPTTTNLTTNSNYHSALFAIIAGTSSSTGINWISDLVVAGTTICTAIPLYNPLAYSFFPTPVLGPYRYVVPAGSTLGISAQCSSTAAARILNGILYGLN